MNPETHAMVVVEAVVEGQMRKEKESIVSSLAAIESQELQPHLKGGLEEEPRFQRSPIQGASLRALSALGELVLPLAQVVRAPKLWSLLLEPEHHLLQISQAVVLSLLVRGRQAVLLGFFVK